MTTDWKTLRDELPAEVRSRLDAKRDARRLGKALAELRKDLRDGQHGGGLSIARSLRPRNSIR